MVSFLPKSAGKSNFLIKNNAGIPASRHQIKNFG
jgi:hypothetical protein